MAIGYWRFSRTTSSFFAIPMANRTCIGTTDTQVDDPVTEYRCGP